VVVLVIELGCGGRACLWRDMRVGLRLGILVVRRCGNSVVVHNVCQLMLNGWRRGEVTDDAMRFFEEFVGWGEVCCGCY
jgi:hypothetical protein